MAVCQMSGQQLMVAFLTQEIKTQDEVDMFLVIYNIINMH